jgi:triosephosphate isomerase
MSAVRRTIIAGNWKMHLVKQEADALINGILAGVESTGRTEVVLFPPFVYLEAAIRKTAGTRLGVGAQNIHDREQGAFTGEISAPMLKSIGCSHVIIGHSERRRYSSETDMDVNRKMKISLQQSLTPVLCIGETLEQKKGGQAAELLNRQLVYGLMGIDEERIGQAIIAYEPVWAIGTGVSATAGQLSETFARIRGILRDFAGERVSEHVRILYGGSVTPGNAPALLSLDDVDGFLVGGASLEAGSFRAIVQAAESLRGHREDESRPVQAGHGSVGDDGERARSN